MLLIVFGLPGSGKTFVGKIIAKQFGFYLHDGDLDLPDDMKDSLSKNEIISDDMRDRFFSKILETIQTLQQQYKNIVVAQTYIKEKYRKELKKKFPNAKFLLVTTPDGIRESRLLARVEYSLDLSYSKNMVANFDTPTIEHIILDNSKDGEDAVINDLQSILLKDK